MSVRVLELPNIPVDKNSINFAQEIENLPGVENMQLYPDCYTKDKYIDLDYKTAIPSSSGIISDVNFLYPQFRSRGIGCGMRAVSLPISVDELTETMISDIMKVLTYNPVYYAAYRLRLPLYPNGVDLSHKQFISLAFGDGSEFSDMSKLLNPKWLSKRTVRMRRCFGRYFGGNHYFELHSSKNDSSDLSIKKNQVIAMFHTGCQGLESLIRPDLAQKFFYQKEYVSTSKDEEMYKAFFAAQEILLRYTYAYRDATQSLIDGVLQKHLKKSSRTLVDNQHNSVARESRGGKDVLVYRHNAITLKEGSLGIISGMKDHESYIVEGGEASEEYFNTIDHGLGNILSRTIEDSKGQGKFVILKNYPKGVSWFKKNDERREIVSNENVTSYFNLLEEKKIAQKKIVLQPIVNLKYT
jgi:hypothetical protein